MRLATYQDCDRREKRAVLQLFWRGAPDTTARVRRAAREYAPYALAATSVITLESAVLAWALAGRGGVWALGGALSGAVALASAWSTVRAAQRWRALRDERAVGLAAPR
ncbi:MAG: hypothetical protein ACP5PB_10895 [Acidimicrobiales bacterium]